MDFPREQLVAFLVAISFAAGLNLYATVATLGLLARAGLLVLPGELGLLANWWVIGAAGALYAIEFVADKIPVVDLIWNALHTFIRVPAGALLGYAATAPLGPEWQMAAVVLGGGVSFIAHGGKTAARAAVTSSPEPWSNFVLSISEDAASIFLTWFATRHPFIAAAIALTGVVLLVLAVRWVIKMIRRFLWNARSGAGN